MPSLIKLSSKYKDKIVILAISGDSSESDMKSFLKSFPGLNSLNSKVIFDSDKKLMDLFGISKLPETLIFNRQTKYLKKVTGSIDWFSPEVDKFIEAQ